MADKSYRGRIAPTPSGYLHAGHARTFCVAHERARAAGGVLVLRNEDLDSNRCKPEFMEAVIEDLKYCGIDWDEGPDKGGEYGPYVQSERTALYLDAWAELRESGLIYPCERSRKEIRNYANAPHAEDEEPVFPPEWRPEAGYGQDFERPDGFVWRFRVPDGHAIVFEDGRLGSKSYTAGEDFGDFVVWSRDNLPAYELAVVVDDSQMGITEVVRGEDLMLSTARQVLLYQALGIVPPDFYHCALVCDASGKRLAKRDDDLSLSSLRMKEVSIRPYLRQLCDEG